MDSSAAAQARTYSRPNLSVVRTSLTAYCAARSAVAEIAYPLSTEDRGIVRFFYCGSSGNVIYVGTHQTRE